MNIELKNKIGHDIGAIKGYVKLPGGLVHDVYKLEFPGKNLILKIRGETFSSKSETKINPTDIEREAWALEILKGGTVLTPKIVQFYRKHNAILMTDIGTDGKVLSDFTDEILADNLNSLIVSFETLEQYCAGINERDSIFNDKQTFERILSDRYGFIKSLKLNFLLQEVNTINHEQQFILGGVSFKNILFTNNEFGFYDFETFCLGHRIFDYGYLFGHLLLHSFCNKKVLFQVLKALRALEMRFNYFKDKSPLNRMIVATLLYRIAHPEIKYGKSDLHSFWKPREFLMRNIIEQESISLKALELI